MRFAGTLTRAERWADAANGSIALAEDVQITYKGPRAPVDLGPLLPSDDEDDDPYDPSKDPSLASPPPSPPLPPFSDDDDDSDAEFEEIGPAGGGDEAEAKARKEAAEAKKRAKREKRERLLREKDERRKERERRRRERQRRREANPMKAEWLPALPPKHSWKQTPVRRPLSLASRLAADFLSPAGLPRISRASTDPSPHIADAASTLSRSAPAPLDSASAAERLATRRRLASQPHPTDGCPLTQCRQGWQCGSRSGRRTDGRREPASTAAGGRHRQLRERVVRCEGCR